MPRPTRSHFDDLRGATRLAIEATRGVTDLVQAMHQEIAAGPEFLGRPLAGPVRLLNELFYGQVRGVTGLVGAGIDLALAQLAPLVGTSGSRLDYDAVLGAVNGVLGDYLAASGNPLAIEMQLRHGDEMLEVERAALRTALPQAESAIARTARRESEIFMGAPLVWPRAGGKRKVPFRRTRTDRWRVLADHRWGSKGLDGGGLRLLR